MSTRNDDDPAVLADNYRARAILWLDSGAAAGAGLLVLALKDWLTVLHAFPRSLLTFVGVANVAYASYSGTLAISASLGKALSRSRIRLLVIANACWAAVCFAILAWMWRSASGIGLVHVAAEAVFVGSLAVAEYRFVLLRLCSQAQSDTTSLRSRPS